MGSETLRLRCATLRVTCGWRENEKMDSRLHRNKE